jgi:hypothetical protein
MKFCYTSEHIDFLRDSFSRMEYRDIVPVFNKRFGLNKTPDSQHDSSTSMSLSGTANNMPRWMTDLAYTIADVFGVRWFQKNTFNGGTTVVFVGIDAYAEISSYAFTVLRRQLVKSRRNYYNSLSRRYKTANRTRKADLFALSWVDAVYWKVAKFAASVRTEELIGTYLAEHHPELATFIPKTHQFKDADADAAMAGHIAAQGVTLNHGMRESDRPRAIA